MKESPILFSAPMVRAILNGTKTQTRRVVQCPHKPWKGRVYDAPWTVAPHSGGGWRAVQHREDGSIPGEVSGAGFPCPYGAPGDRLWVRESAWIYGRWVQDGVTERGRQRWRFRAIDQRVRYEQPLSHELTYWGSEYDGYVFRPSIHLPRWASRLTLEITDVRVERLQDVSTHDVEAEGISIDNNHGGARNEYRDLWNELNAARGFGWDTNPWVWVITFTRFTLPSATAT